MGSPITFSGFNQIDFNMILNAVMQQERRPLQSLEERKTALQTASTTYSTLATKLGDLQAAAARLGDASTVVGYAATSNDEHAVKVSATTGAAPGHYDIVVSQLARAQVRYPGWPQRTRTPRTSRRRAVPHDRRSDGHARRPRHAIWSRGDHQRHRRNRRHGERFGNGARVVQADSGGQGLGSGSRVHHHERPVR